MLRKLRPRSAYDVIALLGLFVALGGTTYAAATIGAANIKDDAVRSRHVKDGEVKNPDLGANAVRSAKVADGSLLKQDFKAGQLPRGPAGPGAISFDRQFPVDGKFHNYTVGDFLMRALCDNSLGEADLVLKPIDGNHAFYAWGTGAADGGLAHVSGTESVVAGAGNAAELDVVAESTAPGEAIRWTRFDMTVIKGNSCNFHAMVTPSSSVK